MRSQATPETEDSLSTKSDKPLTGSFVEDLESLREQMTGEKITIAEIEGILQGRGFATLGLILCIPFVQPIPLPGVSIVFGLAVMVLGIKLVLGRSSMLPRFLAKREIHTETLRSISSRAIKIFSHVDHLFKPRLAFMFNPPLLTLVGFSLVLSGFALSLPLPPIILFSNSLPAWAVILLCLGILERDGLMIAMGHCIALATWCYFAFWWEVVRFAIEALFLT
ncbi:exopolysaccharide biosynthesis protein [Oligoflexus tunisiensis]|uniref:exopolysaccharide biosynthesis protein n=1 Tax=Oligoflexus tunisiensis TaxID=708132 RepID=UPI00114D1A68|nr:exopolysaccharide biosynthesis protein [Oligoflexus tunisiensis]